MAVSAVVSTTATTFESWSAPEGAGRARGDQGHVRTVAHREGGPELAGGRVEHADRRDGPGRRPIRSRRPCGVWGEGQVLRRTGRDVDGRDHLVDRGVDNGDGPGRALGDAQQA